MQGVAERQLQRSPWWRTWAIILGAAVVAAVSARSYVGGWNDGSRLATVECLVDHETWAIDDSVFAGTKDKLLIGGRYYSDKSPVPAVLMAGQYALLKAITGWTAAADETRFCEVLCLVTAGLAYVVAVWSIDRLGRVVGLSSGIGLALTASFAFATVAPVYARHVNNHILLLAVAAALLVELIELGRTDAAMSASRRLVIAGALSGLAYTIDLGAGPVIMLAAAALVVYRRRLGGLLTFALAAVPCVLLHHALNFAIGGTIGPANANLEYLNWPGSPFNAANATGGWAHPTITSFVWYAVSLLVGLKGFLIHNPPLLLAVPAVVRLIIKRVPETPELLMACAWAVGTWLLYAAASTNCGGLCCSIRWFVPLLAPGYFVLAVMLREMPWLGRDLAALSAWGALLVAVMWPRGPWMPHLVPYWWVYLAGGLMTWAVVRGRFSARDHTPTAPVIRKPLAA